MPKQEAPNCYNCPHRHGCPLIQLPFDFKVRYCDRLAALSEGLTSNAGVEYLKILSDTERPTTFGQWLGKLQEEFPTLLN